jgi:hypothetical protein
MVAVIAQAVLRTGRMTVPPCFSVFFFPEIHAVVFAPI